MKNCFVASPMRSVLSLPVVVASRGALFALGSPSPAALLKRLAWQLFATTIGLCAFSISLINSAYAQASTQVITLTFEGLKHEEQILNFYNGGTGSLGSRGFNNHGIYFSEGAVAFIDADAGGTGNFANEPTPDTAVTFLSGSALTMNVPGGFSNGFSFYYSASQPAQVRVYSGENSTGNLLATIDLVAQHDANGCTGDPNGLYCNWSSIGVTFSGIARSVDFSGTANKVGFDNITLGLPLPLPAVTAIAPATARLDVSQTFKIQGSNFSGTLVLAIEDCLMASVVIGTTQVTAVCTPVLPGIKRVFINGSLVPGVAVFVDHPTRTGDPTARGIPSINGVSMFNGNFFHSVTDMSVPGKGLPFELRRSYNSYYWEPEHARGTVDNYKPWRFNWDLESGFVADSGQAQLYVQQADGSSRSFYLDTGVWYPIDQGSFDVLMQATCPATVGAGTCVKFNQRNGNIYWFEWPTAATNGRLKQVCDHSDNCLTVTHDAASRRVSGVTDTMGRLFQFSYYPATDANGRAGYLQRVTTSDGQSLHGSSWGVTYDWTVDYAPAPNQTRQRARIKSVTDLRGSVWTYTYVSYPASSTSGPRVLLEALFDPAANAQFMLLHAAKAFGNYAVVRMFVPDGDSDATASALYWDFNFVARDAAGTALTGTDVGLAASFETTARPPSDVCSTAACLRVAKFDTAGRLTSMTVGSNTRTAALRDKSALTTRNYNLAAQLVEQRSPLGAATAGNYATQFQYDTTTPSWLAAVTRPRDASVPPNTTTRTFKNDVALLARNLLLSNNIATPEGLTYGRDFDAQGRLINRTDPGGGVTTIGAYNTAGQPGQVQNALGNIGTFGYTAQGATPYNGYLSSVTRYEGDGVTVAANQTMEYDRLGRVISRTQKVDGTRSATWKYEYYADGRVKRIYDPLHTTVDSRFVEMDYTAAGQLLWRRDQRNQQTDFTYDAANRLKRQSTTFTQNAVVQTVYVETIYDSLSRVRSVTNGRANQVASNTYDEVSGKIKQRSNVLAYATGYEYDADDRLWRVTDPEGRKTETQYYYDGLIKSVTTYGKVNGTVQALTTTYEYDKDGRLKAKVNPRGTRTTYEYHDGLSGNNQAGRLARIFDGTLDANNFPNRVSLSYDRAGNVTTIRDLNYNFINLSYDALNRETRRTVGSDYWETFYDLAGNVVKRTAPGSPRLETTYSYDILGQLTNILLPGATTPIVFEYDKSGNRTKVTDGSGTLGYSAYVYDAVNRLVKVTDSFGKVIEFSYDAANNRTGVKYPNGQWVYYDYDQLERMYRVRPWTGGNTTYALDKSGRVAGTTTFGNGTSMQTEFDEGGRLTSLTNLSPAAPGGTISSHPLQLDANGNISSAANTLPLELDVAASTTNMTHDGSNRLLSVNGQSVVHDLAGRITSLLGSTYTYDGRDLITGVGGASSASYAYNGLGHRVSSTIAGTSKRYVYDPNAANPTMQNVLTETDTVGNALRHYVYGYGLIAQIDSANAVKHYHFDPTGHTLALTNAAGNITDAYAYTSYGLTTARGDTVNPYRYVGKYGVSDDGNGLLHMRARYYRPDIARFVSLDAVTGDASESQSLNRYGYGAGNPIANTDPTGLFSWSEALRQSFGGVRESWEDNNTAVEECALADDGCGGALVSIVFRGAGLGMDAIWDVGLSGTALLTSGPSQGIQQLMQWSGCGLGIDHICQTAPLSVADNYLESRAGLNEGWGGAVVDVTRTALDARKLVLSFPALARDFRNLSLADRYTSMALALGKRTIGTGADIDLAQRLFGAQSTALKFASVLRGKADISVLSAIWDTTSFGYDFGGKSKDLLNWFSK